jgi:hypothetical protein
MVTAMQELIFATGMIAILQELRIVELITAVMQEFMNPE